MIKNIFFVGIAIVLLVIAAVIYFRSYNVIVQANEVITEQATASSVNSETLTGVENDSPRFEFYSLLSETTVTIPDEDEQQNAQEKDTQNDDENASPDESVSSKQYALQIASFRYREEAEKLRRQLFRQGFDVHIEEFNNEDVIWYRVRWGDFPSLQAAEHGLEELNTYHINALLQRIH